MEKAGWKTVYDPKSEPSSSWKQYGKVKAFAYTCNIPGDIFFAENIKDEEM